MGKKHKNVSRILNYIDHSLIVLSTITGCVSISAFASLVGIPIGITSCAIGLKVCGITAGIKLNSIEVLISKDLINSNISYDEFVKINNVLKEFYDMKEEIKNSNDK